MRAKLLGTQGNILPQTINFHALSTVGEVGFANHCIAYYIFFRIIFVQSGMPLGINLGPSHT